MADVSLFFLRRRRRRRSSEATSARKIIYRVRNETQSFLLALTRFVEWFVVEEIWEARVERVVDKESAVVDEACNPMFRFRARCTTLLQRINASTTRFFHN